MRASGSSGLGVAGDLGLRHREAHVGEEAAGAALADVPLGLRRTARPPPRRPRRSRAPRPGGASSTVVTTALCRWRTRVAPSAPGVPGDLALGDDELDARIGLLLLRVREHLGRVDRGALRIQPVAVEVLVGRRRLQRLGGRRYAPGASSRCGRRCSRRRHRRRGSEAASVRPFVPLPPHAGEHRARAWRRSRSSPPTPRLYDRGGEGDRHPRGRRAGGPPVRGRRRTRSPGRARCCPDACGVAEPPRRLDAEGHAVRAEAADPRRRRLRRRRSARGGCRGASSPGSRS